MLLVLVFVCGMFVGAIIAVVYVWHGLASGKRTVRPRWFT